MFNKPFYVKQLTDLISMSNIVYTYFDKSNLIMSLYTAHEINHFFNPKFQ